MEILKQFVTGGVMVAGVSYLGNYVDPILAGLIAGIPIGLPTIYFITGKAAIPYIRNLLITTYLLCFVTTLFYVLYTKLKWDKDRALLVSMITWIIVVFIIYQLEHNYKFYKKIF